ncbi:GNAT family N-acetyltransferase [Nocardioides sp.]|uniref:GNAT family N-acetyltransferase n=1 Tax=Nocardioides sp. TaxID=35761 RepID=UPI001A298D42|nr:GNAT family N-acetyltransferase [Nocardioides sp.]MBJ7359944.1 GNAT family N-acetyltransferase [Nocardioides sp.]
MTSPTLTLPPGLSTRPVEMTDAPAVTALVAAEELLDIGEVAIEEADYVSDWQKPSFDLASQTISVWDGDRVVGFAQVEADRGDAAVHPDYRRRGIGTALATWMQQTARAGGSTVIGAPVPQGKAGDQLLEKLGYRVRWQSWVLELLDGATIPERPLPEGYTVREARPDEHEAVWTVTEDAFLEWSERKRQAFEDWQATVPGRPGFEPWNIRVVIDPTGEVVATANVHLNRDGERVGAYIDRLATRKDQRHKGIAQALLVDSFAVARSHGAVRSELSTDSRTGALGLYEKVGMSVTSVWVNRAKDL